MSRSPPWIMCCANGVGETKDMALVGHILATVKGVELERVHQWVWGSQLSPLATIDIASLQQGVPRDRSEDTNLDEHVLKQTPRSYDHNILVSSIPS